MSRGAKLLEVQNLKRLLLILYHISPFKDLVHTKRATYCQLSFHSLKMLILCGKIWFYGQLKIFCRNTKNIQPLDEVCAYKGKSERCW